MNRREFLIKSLSAAGLVLISGCGQPAYLAGGGYRRFREPEETAGNRYIPRPIPKEALQNKQEISAGLTIYAKSAWDSTPPIISKLKSMGNISRITVHHEGNSYPYTETNPSETAMELQRVKQSHMRRMRAGDIGYHYIIDPAGNVWEGRSVKYQGAHVRSHNSENLGIMLLGNFEIQKPTAKQFDALDTFLGLQMERYNVPPEKVFGHRDLVATECPGENLYVRLPELACLCMGGGISSRKTPLKIQPEPAKTPAAAKAGSKKEEDSAPIRTRSLF